MPPARAAYDRILQDMREIWGNLAEFMLKKRVDDVGAKIETLTKDDLVRIVNLLRDRTLPPTLGALGAQRKAEQYLAWIREMA